MFCPNCGKSVSENAKFCIECGFNLKQLPANNQGGTPAQAAKPSLRCRICDSTEINVQLVESGQITNRNGIGFDGKMHNAGRKIAAISTFGISNLFIPKAEGRNNTRTIMKKVAICQKCGNTWEIR